ncbi:MAG TPA: hypothetical protein PKG49_09580 [Nitrosomonas mobilis]|uniref:Uncharacterized protein n=1 Tax=Nitrosomonas mobilis TaxID=51642 RepID=A0A1G5SB86_9PROT|nr:hypothetical protein NSMM_140020 [Nitrosomonas mobilis]HNO75842.1 hypothetical protein [Nitrosomonas mobilis]
MRQRERKKLKGMLARLTYAQYVALKEGLAAENEEAAVIETIEMEGKSVVCPHCEESIVRNGSANGMQRYKYCGCAKLSTS